jgi:hypothetical protein
MVEFSFDKKPKAANKTEESLNNLKSVLEESIDIVIDQLKTIGEVVTAFIKERDSKSKSDTLPKSKNAMVYAEQLKKEIDKVMLPLQDRVSSVKSELE